MAGRRIWRHEVVRAVNRIVDANSLEDLLRGSHEESVKLCTVLLDLASGGPRHGRTAQGVARRRGLSASYIEDRARVLLGSAQEGGRQDAYRILGLSPLSSLEAIRERWRQLARELHPDSRGDANGLRKFFAVKRAYDTLSDPAKRRAYDQRWKHTISVIDEARGALEEGVGEPLWRRWWGGGKVAGRVEAEGARPAEGVPDPRWQEVAQRLASLAVRWREIGGRLALGAGWRGRPQTPVAHLIEVAGKLEGALATSTMCELEEMAERIAALLPMLGQVRQGIETLRELKKVVGV